MSEARWMRTGGRASSPSRGPVVDVVIPVHREERPIERAVASVVDGSDGLVRAVVVCHNIVPEAFGDRLSRFGTGVLVEHLEDGIPSAAGPLNRGLDSATAHWVTCMGSDDYFEAGAARSWIEHLRARPVDALMLRMLHQESGQVERIPVRPRRLRDLDFVRDRLAWRTGPQTIFKTAMLRENHIRMTEGLRTSEDLEYSLHGLTASRHIDMMPASAPMYVAAVDGGERLTGSPLPLEVQFGAVRHLVGQKWLLGETETVRNAIGTRIIRKSILPYVVPRVSSLPADELALTAQILREWTTLTPRALVPMSSVERRLIEDLMARRDNSQLVRDVAAFDEAPKSARLLPRDRSATFAPESPVMHLASRRLGDAP